MAKPPQHTSFYSSHYISWCVSRDTTHTMQRSHLHCIDSTLIFLLPYPDFITIYKRSDQNPIMDSQAHLSIRIKDLQNCRGFHEGDEETIEKPSDHQFVGACGGLRNREGSQTGVRCEVGALTLRPRMALTFSEEALVHRHAHSRPRAPPSTPALGRSGCERIQLLSIRKNPNGFIIPDEEIFNLHTGLCSSLNLILNSFDNRYRRFRSHFPTYNLALNPNGGHPLDFDSGFYLTFDLGPALDSDSSPALSSSPNCR
ncbi:hypothetical protein EVAR_78391_1 [Eumeta japonica]|uniref:Uncharacterized protein n=1 Tax=Eumeta variegata TaxID=151549 RepID=A0A4C1T4C6_EUMVA|nr:hypothetical protein EVAR_78391_1 [Eumeta japonica]